MEFGEVVRKRRMVRHFSAEPVAPEAVEQILELARHAPSAGFTQGQSFVVVTEPEVKQAIARTCAEEEYIAGGFHRFISQAPVLIIPCTSEAAYHRRYQEPDKLDENGQEIAWPVPYWHMDIGCSVMLVLLAAVDVGLAAGFAGAQDLNALRAVLGIPADVIPVGVIPVGHRAADTPSPSLKRGRRPDAELVHRGRW
jgi:nitroreductase